MGPLTKTKVISSFFDRLTKMIRLCPMNNRVSAKGTENLFHHQRGTHFLFLHFGSSSSKLLE